MVTTLVPELSDDRSSFWVTGEGHREIAAPWAPFGRPFHPVAELDLWPDLRSAASQLRTTRETQTVSVAEYPFPGGVPDLTVFRVRSELLDVRLGCESAPILSERDARLVAACTPSRGAQIQNLAAIVGSTEVHTRRILMALCKQGAVEFHGSRWRRVAGMGPVATCFALEAKVSDWRAGFWQCLRYANFAQATGLVLGRISERTEFKARQAAKAHGIGLFVDNRWVIEPRPTRHLFAKRLLISEHLVAALLVRPSGRGPRHQIPSASA